MIRVMLKQILLIFIFLVVGGGSVFLGVVFLESDNIKNATQTLIAKPGYRSSENLTPESAQINQLMSNDWYLGLVPEALSRIHPKQFDIPFQKSHSQTKLPPKLIENLVVSDSFPYIVWEGLGEKVSYELWVGGVRYAVPANPSDIIAVRIEKFEGVAYVQLNAFLNGVIISGDASVENREYENVNSLKWVADNRVLGLIPQTFKDLPMKEIVKVGRLLEKEDMWVAAMSCYRQFSLENPEELEIIPYLLRTYRKLNLKKTYQKEMENWSSLMKS